VSTTHKVYARFSPSFLKNAAAVLEYDDLSSTNLRERPKAAFSFWIDGGRDRDRTCDPLHVKEVLFR
jgi:hypothetical protein